MSKPTEPADAQAVLDRAIELQHRETNPELTPNDLETIAEELGVERRHVHTALAERRQLQPVVETRFHLWGAPTSLVFDMRLEQPLTPQECTVLVDLARQRLGTQGRVRNQGDGMTWSAKRTQVALMPLQNHTRLSVSRKMGGTAVALFVPILTVLFLGALGAAIPLGIVYGSLWLPIFGVVFGMLCVFGALRALFASIVASRRCELESLRDVLLDAACTNRKGQMVLPSFEAEVEEAKQVVVSVHEA